MTTDQAPTEAPPQPAAPPEPAPAAPPEPPKLPERPWPTNVVQAIARVMEELPGIGKDGTAAPAQGGYAYRSIEGITAAAQHLLGRYGVVFVPRVAERRMPVVELDVGGKPWTEEQLTIVYTVYGPGGVGDHIEVGPLVALGRDNVDKGTNKCMTQAFKYALLQVLCIGDNKDDADSGSAQADSHGKGGIDPATWYTENGWLDIGEHDDARAELVAQLGAAPSTVRTAFGKWFRDQGDLPEWKMGWSHTDWERMDAKLAELAAHVPAERTEAPAPSQAPEAGPQPPPATDTGPAPETAADGPQGATDATADAAMPWEGLPPLPPAAPPADPPLGDDQATLEAKAAILAHVNTLTPKVLTELLEKRKLGISGSTKDRRARLAKAMVAEGWTEP